jgi:NitT/TauT family transport system substrate-binding protein
MWRTEQAVAVLIVVAGLLACTPSGTPSRSTNPVPAPPVANSGASPPAQAATESPPIETVKISFASDSAVYAPFFIAIEKGYLREEGLEMEMIKAGGGAATPALISGDIQYSTSAASSVSATLKGAPLRVVYTNSDRPGYELWSSADGIRTLADLVGQSIAVQSRGDTMEIAARLDLQQHGIDPDSVSYVAAGYGSAQRIATLQTGSAAAAILGIADVVQVRNAGPTGHRLSNIRDEVQMLYTGLATSDQELQEHRDRVKRLLRATIEGREYYKAFKEETLQIMGKYNERPPEANEADYDDVIPAMTGDGSMPEEVQQRDTALRAAINGVEQAPPVGQIYDYSVAKEIYAELQAAGWQPTR